jgi:hypothetical protein
MRAGNRETSGPGPSTLVLQLAMAAHDEGGTHALDSVEGVCSIQVSNWHHLNSCFLFLHLWLQLDVFVPLNIFG